MDIEVQIGVGSRDGVALVDEERVVVDPAMEVGVRYDEGRRASRSFSSCNLVYDTAWAKEIGCNTCTSLQIDGLNPEIKQLSTNGTGKPTIIFARDSNSERYAVTNERC